MAILVYLDENDFRKKERALRKYFMRNYKYLQFDFFPRLKQEGKRDGRYSVKLATSKLFESVYGKMELLFSVKNDVAILEDIAPGDFLLDCYEREVPCYKGIPYRNKKDLEKIKIMERLNGKV